jgi:hypothetical protein
VKQILRSNDRLTFRLTNKMNAKALLKPSGNQWPVTQGEAYREMTQGFSNMKACGGCNVMTKGTEGKKVVSHFIFLLRQASEGVFFLFFFQVGLFSEEKRVLHQSYVS